jgi:hypothetical protein
MRRQRLAIGLIAAYAVLFAPLIGAFAQPGDPLQSYLSAHLCAPDGGSDQSGGTGAPIERKDGCALCGPACPMGGMLSLAAAVPVLRPFQPPRRLAAVAVASKLPGRAKLAVYPSDTISQAPPRAA